MAFERDEGWHPRPVVAGCVQALIVAGPTVAGVLAGLLLAQVMPRSTGYMLWVWWSGVLAGSWLVVALAERSLRRLAPLPTLFRMSLVLPDRLPNRFSVALRGGRGGDDGEDEVGAQAVALLVQVGEHHRRTRGHSERVRALAVLIAEDMGLTLEARDRLAWGAALHDVGKVSVPTTILDKNGRPDADEWAVLAGHPAAGASLAVPLQEWMGEHVHAIDQHHERWDGTGYPGGLAGTEIAIGARIVAVADSFETMTAARSYKKPMSIEAARREVAEGAGGQFDPAVARAFLSIGVPKLVMLAGPAALLAQVPLLGLGVRALIAPTQAAGAFIGSAAPWAGSALLTAGALATPAAAASMDRVDQPADAVVAPSTQTTSAGDDVSEGTSSPLASWPDPRADTGARWDVAVPGPGADDPDDGSASDDPVEGPDTAGSGNGNGYGNGNGNGYGNGNGNVGGNGGGYGNGNVGGNGGGYGNGNVGGNGGGYGNGNVGGNGGGYGNGNVGGNGGGYGNGNAGGNGGGNGNGNGATTPVPG